MLKCLVLRVSRFVSIPRERKIVCIALPLQWDAWIAPSAFFGAICTATE